MNKLIHISLLMALALVVAACSNAPHKNKASGPYAGIDVSRHQKDIDWTKVGCDSCVTFVYIKATEGATIVDPQYGANVAGAHREGIMVGSYHFFSSTSPVKAQFDNFMRATHGHKQDLIPMIDVEKQGNFSRSQLIDSVAKLAAMMEQQFKRKPMIYSTMEFYNSYLAPQFNTYPLYIGRYSTAKPQLKWGGKYTIWQYTEHGIITGINKHVDLCTFNDDKSLEDISL